MSIFTSYMLGECCCQFKAPFISPVKLFVLTSNYFPFFMCFTFLILFHDCTINSPNLTFSLFCVVVIEYCIIFLYPCLKFPPTDLFPDCCFFICLLLPSSKYNSTSCIQHITLRSAFCNKASKVFL